MWNCVEEEGKLHDGTATIIFPTKVSRNIALRDLRGLKIRQREVVFHRRSRGGAVSWQSMLVILVGILMLIFALQRAAGNDNQAASGCAEMTTSSSSTITNPYPKTETVTYSDATTPDHTDTAATATTGAQNDASPLIQQSLRSILNVPSRNSSVSNYGVIHDVYISRSDYDSFANHGVISKVYITSSEYDALVNHGVIHELPVPSDAYKSFENAGIIGSICTPKGCVRVERGNE